MTSSTPLPPPTEEHLEGLRMFIGALMHSMPDSLMPYLAVLAGGLEVNHAIGANVDAEPFIWRFTTPWQPVKEEVGDDD